MLDGDECWEEKQSSKEYIKSWGRETWMLHRVAGWHLSEDLRTLKEGHAMKGEHLVHGLEEGECLSWSGKAGVVKAQELRKVRGGWYPPSGMAMVRDTGF